MSYSNPTKKRKNPKGCEPSKRKKFDTDTDTSVLCPDISSMHDSYFEIQLRKRDCGGSCIFCNEYRQISGEDLLRITGGEFSGDTITSGTVQFRDFNTKSLLKFNFSAVSCDVYLHHQYPGGPKLVTIYLGRKLGSITFSAKDGVFDKVRVKPRKFTVDLKKGRKWPIDNNEDIYFYQVEPKRRVKHKYLTEPFLESWKALAEGGDLDEKLYDGTVRFKNIDTGEEVSLKFKLRGCFLKKMQQYNNTGSTILRLGRDRDFIIFPAKGATFELNGRVMDIPSFDPLRRDWFCFFEGDHYVNLA